MTPFFAARSSALSAVRTASAVGLVSPSAISSSAFRTKVRVAERTERFLRRRRSWTRICLAADFVLGNWASPERHRNLVCLVLASIGDVALLRRKLQRPDVPARGDWVTDC